MTDINGLCQMRARYYNPEIRRFINQDLLLGSITNGQSLNRYAYVNGCPISYVDPFGLSRDGDTQTSPDLLPPAEMWTPENLRDSQRVAGYVMAGSLAVATAGLGAELLSAGSYVITAAREFVTKGSNKVAIPNAENLKMSKTVLNHTNDIIKKGPNKGELSRPYVNSNGTTFLTQEIMNAGTPVKDAFLKNGLRWDVTGYLS